MPKYIYTAKNYEGQAKGGELVAKDEKELARQLRSEGFIVTSVKGLEEKKSGISISFFDRFKSVPIKEKMMFARNLRVMVASGLTISRAINNLATQTKNKTFKKILLEIYEDSQAGKSLSDSLAKYPSVFNELFVNMVRVGETGGSLEEVLGIIEIQLEKENDLLSKVKGAMIYPAVIIVVMIGIAILMLTYILPKMLGVFKDMNVELPVTTQFIINMSDFLTNHSILVLIGLIGSVIGFKVFIKTSAGKKVTGFIVLRLPAISNIVIKVNCARFARIYSSLLRSGVSVVDTLKIISNTLGNVYYKEAVNEAIEQVQKGVALSKVVSKYPKIFPVLVPQMIEVGEETGKTEEILLKLAEFYEEEVNQITKNLSSIIEPVLMVFIGGAVGFFAVAMLQPMYSMMENIK